MDQRPTKEQLEPTGDWLMVEAFHVPEISKGGIVMPTGTGPSVSQEAYGKILKTGPGYYQNGKQIPPGVKAGDTVLFRKGRVLYMRFNWDKVIFMTMRDLLAVVG